MSRRTRVEDESPLCLPQLPDGAMTRDISIDTITSSNQDNESSTKGDDTSQQCATEGCKRKLGVGCFYQMCFTCCYMLGDDKNEVCSFHEKAREAKKRKDRYIEEGLEKVNQIGKKRKKMDHPAEELFTDYNQTVLIWCFSDFVRDRKISEDAFDKQEKEEQRNKRARGEWTNIVADNRSKYGPIYVTQTASQKSRKARNSKFKRVKASWCNKLKIPTVMPGWLQAKENPGVVQMKKAQESPSKSSSISNGSHSKGGRKTTTTPTRNGSPAKKKGGKK